MKPICFIAARGGSKGIARKNIRLFAGKPLIAHTIESALNSYIFSHVIVSTEDDEIASISKKYGAEIPYSRPKKLATDKASMSDVLLHGVRTLYSLGYKFDVFVNRDCTAPFIRNIDIAGSVDLLKKRKCDAVFGVYRQHHNPYFNMMEPDHKGFLRLSKSKGQRPVSRQDTPVVYQLNGLFVYDSKKFLKNRDSIVIPRVLPYEIPAETGWMIDTEIEFHVAELMFKHKLVDIN